ncbi:MAG: hypothetical protein AAF360_10510 [Pseudomonadota bacterium]
MSKFIFGCLAAIVAICLWRGGADPFGAGAVFWLIGAFAVAAGAFVRLDQRGDESAPSSYDVRLVRRPER